MARIAQACDRALEKASVEPSSRLMAGRSTSPDRIPRSVTVDQVFLERGQRRKAPADRRRRVFAP
jgi:hypothetical protein